MHVTVWDVLLVLGVSLQSLVLAYVYEPRWKAFLLNLPVPFTLASMSLGQTLGQKMDVTNVCGMVSLYVFSHGVRLLYTRLRAPIFVSIGASVLAFFLVGWGLAAVVPNTGATFWLMAGGVGVASAVVLWLTPHRMEAGHRSPMPIWLKLPIIMMVVVVLVILKKQLLGIMTFFPMVGVVAAYEARNSLWAICRQMPVLMLTMLPLMAVVRICESRLGWAPAPSLALGWVVFLAVLVPVTRRMWSGIRAQEACAAEAA